MRDLRRLTTFLVLGSVLAPTAALAAGGENSFADFIYQAINLVIILAVLFYFARKPALEYFATRRADVQRDLQAAGDLLSDAEARYSEIQQKLAELQSETEEIRENSNNRKHSAAQHDRT